MAGTKTGVNNAVYGEGYDLTSYFTSSGEDPSVDQADASVFGKHAKDHRSAQEDNTWSMDGFFAGGQEEVDEILHPLLGRNNSVWNQFPHADDAIGDIGRGCDGQLQGYPMDTPTDNMVTITAAIQSNVGSEQCWSLHPKATRTATETGTAHNYGRSTPNGGAAYLQVFAASGTLDVVVEHSSTGAFAGEEATIATFSQVTGASTNNAGAVGKNAQRIDIAYGTTINQYVRAKATIAGGSPSFTYHCSYSRRRAKN